MKHRRYEDTPQGVLSLLLLTKILLDGLDKRLVVAGHYFCHQANDYNTYLRSTREGYWVVSWMRRYLNGELTLNVNDVKNGMPRAQQCRSLGLTFECGK